MSIWDTDKDKVVDCTTPMTYEEYKRMTNQYCRNVAHTPMTNEEWIKSASTELLAEILVYMAEDKSETKTVHKENVGKCVWWLKQPHNKGVKNAER